MEKEYEIIYSEKELRMSIQNVLDSVDKLQYDSFFRESAGKKLIDIIQTWKGRLSSCNQDTLNVAVVGDFKRGKSTFINALLGEEVVTTDVTTETVTLNRISYGTHSNEAILGRGRRMRISDEDLKRENLEILQQKESFQYLDIFRENEVLKKITIYDTPGMGDSLADFSPMVTECLHGADVVIYIYNVRYPLSRGEQCFLRSLVNNQPYTSLFLLGNFADTLENQEQYDKLKTLIKGRVEDILPDTEIIMISGLQELMLQLGENRRCKISGIIDEEFARFRTILDQLLVEKQKTVLVDRMQRFSSLMYKELCQEIDYILDASKANHDEVLSAVNQQKIGRDEFLKNIEAKEQEIRDSIAAMNNQTERWMLSLLDKMLTELRNMEKVSFDDLSRYYEIYFLDTLEKALQECFSYHEELIQEELGGTIESMQNTSPLRHDLGFNLNNRVWTHGDTFAQGAFYTGSIVGAILGAVIGLGGLGSSLGSIVALGTTGVVHDIEKNAKSDELKISLMGKLESAAKPIALVVKKQYECLSKSILEEYRTQIDEEIASQEELLERVLQVSSKSSEEKERICSMMNSIKDNLKELKEIFE